MTSWLSRRGGPLIPGDVGTKPVQSRLDGLALLTRPLCRLSFLAAQFSDVGAASAAIVDEERKVKHSAMAEQIEKALMQPAAIGVKLKPDALDIAFPPTVQSGGTYDLRANAPNTDKPLQYDVILMSIGATPSLLSGFLASL